jgi:MoaA/NifB/PqqE/SkfB family radical SAM enzyme
MFLGRESFFPQPDRQSAKELFKKNVRRIEIETHSYCNRRCGYCPNVVGDRLGENKRMSEDVWFLVLRNLQEIDYDGNFVLNSYNEPLADRIILDRIREVRSMVPKARTLIYTNGDYLTPAYVQNLADAGLQYMHVSIHMGPDDKYSDVYALDRISEVTTRMGIPAKFQNLKSGEYILTRAPHKSIEIEVRAINYWKHGTDRGGLLEGFDAKQARTAPCYFPFSHFHIGFEGTVVPCCHIRSDNEQHRPYRYGNVLDYGSIYQIYASRVATEWRRHLISFEEKGGPCRTCPVPFPQDPNILAQVRSAAEHFVAGEPLPPTDSIATAEPASSRATS